MESFQDSQELYIHHRNVWDEILREELSSLPKSPILSFWTVFCAHYLDIVPDSHKGYTHFYIHGITASSTSSPTVDLFLYVPTPFFTLCYADKEKSVSLVPRRYCQFVMDLLNDPSRAGPYVIS